ncbi:hypothetical protein DFH09DRAFT_959149 [Mycena vulgaris]|nr:hypothetical protein DFH09DRAFT_959149 [Mycena vulgaris]
MRGSAVSTLSRRRFIAQIFCGGIGDRTGGTLAVSALPIHLHDAKSNRQYLRSANSSVLSQLDQYFLRPHGSFILDGTLRQFNNLTYAEYYTIFRLAKYVPDKVGPPGYYLEQANNTDSPRLHVIMRTSAHSHVTRIRSVRPSQGELFYLRAILQARPCRSFTMARTVRDVTHPTFEEAANDLGLFADSDEATHAVLEGIHDLRTPRELRTLFVHLLVN